MYTEHNNDGPDHSMYGASNHLTVMLEKHQEALQHAAVEPSMLQESSNMQVRHIYESSHYKPHQETIYAIKNMLADL